MSLTPHDKTLLDIFKGVPYDIDFYQRDYKWNDKLEYKPVSSLLEDIMERFQPDYNPELDIKKENINKLPWYYLNSYVTNVINDKHFIVDGQQRLTTLTLIIIVLYHLANEKRLSSDIADTLKDLIKGNTTFGPKYWIGFKDRHNAIEDIFKNSLNFASEPKNSTETNIYDNYNTIYDYLEKIMKTNHILETFINYFICRIYLIEIQIVEPKDVAMVFEVINDRGVPLKPYEILKGKLISRINPNDREEYVSTWEESIKQIEEYGEYLIDDFFSYYFRSQYNITQEQYAQLDRDKYHKVIFSKEFNQLTNFRSNSDNIKKFIGNDLKYFSAIFVELLKYAWDYNKKYEYVYFNASNDLNGQYVLILSSISFKDKYKNDKIKLVSKLFDKHHVLLRLSGSYRAADLNTDVIFLNNKIHNKSLKEIESEFNARNTSSIKKAHDRQKLTSQLPYEFFKSIGYITPNIGTKFLRYFYARIDHFISDSSDFPEFGTFYQLAIQTKGGDVYHIEHIISNNIKNKKLFKDEEEFNNERNRLGGLLLLKGKDNESSGDELYEDKLKTYNTVGTYFARSLLKDIYHKKVQFNKFIQENNLNFKPYNTYGKNEIEERHKLLYDLIKLIWLT